MITSRRGSFVNAFGALGGTLLFVGYLGLGVLFWISSSYAIDAWFGTPGWLSVAIVGVMIMFLPDVVFILGVIGFFYWP